MRDQVRANQCCTLPLRSNSEAQERQRPHHERIQVRPTGTKKKYERKRLGRESRFALPRRHQRDGRSSFPHRFYACSPRAAMTSPIRKMVPVTTIKPSGLLCRAHAQGRRQRSPPQITEFQYSRRLAVVHGWWPPADWRLWSRLPVRRWGTISAISAALCRAWRQRPMSARVPESFLKAPTAAPTPQRDCARHPAPSRAAGLPPMAALAEICHASGSREFLSICRGVILNPNCPNSSAAVIAKARLRS